MTRRRTGKVQVSPDRVSVPSCSWEGDRGLRSEKGPGSGSVTKDW